MAARNKADFRTVSDEGDRVKSRRERLGLDKRNLALEAGISRETLAAIESGQGFRRSSLTKIERVLDALEAEAGLTAPPPRPGEPEAPAQAPTVVIRLGDGKGAVVVEGPVDNLDALIEAAERLRRSSASPDDGL